MLGHCVISQGMRPTWPAAMRQGSRPEPSLGGGGGSIDGAPCSPSSSSPAGGGNAWSGLIALTERCWAQEPQARCVTRSGASRLLQQKATQSVLIAGIHKWCKLIWQTGANHAAVHCPMYASCLASWKANVQYLAERLQLWGANKPASQPHSVGALIG